MKTKKDLKYYLNLPYSIEIIPEKKGYFVKIKELPGCMSQGETKEEAFKNIEEAKHLWIATSLKRNLPIPEPEQHTDFSGKLLLRLPKSLHAKLSLRANEEGISLNQYILSLLSANSSVDMVKREIRECVNEIKELEHENTIRLRDSYKAEYPSDETYKMVNAGIYSQSTGGGSAKRKSN